MVTMPGDRQRYRGLLLDMGGVLTTDFFAAIGAHCRRLGLPPDRFREVVTRHPLGRQLYRQIERGEISQTTFERGIADLLGVDSHGLLRGLLADAQPNAAMIEAVQRARGAGVRAGVITNSWGTEPFNPYEGYDLDKRFDAVVISGEVGLSKPDPAIYQLAASRLGLPAPACVFVDDIADNLPPAHALGMATVHHVDNSTTLDQLERLLGIPLRTGDGSRSPATGEPSQRTNG